MFTGCPETKAATLLIRGGAQQFIDEAERSIHDAMMIVKSAMKSTKIVGGGGAIELELARYLKEYSRTISGKQQKVIERFAKALETIPRTLIQNSGGDATDILAKLRTKHALPDTEQQIKDGDHNRWYGVDCINNDIRNTLKDFIWEPTVVKENALESACEACCLILSIDETIKNPQSEQPNKGKGAKGAKGFGQNMAGMARGGKGKGMRQLQNKLA